MYLNSDAHYEKGSLQPRLIATYDVFESAFFSNSCSIFLWLIATYDVFECETKKGDWSNSGGLIATYDVFEFEN